MAKYRIRIEALDPAEELRAEYRIGIECDGFCIIADEEDGHDTSIHHMSTVDIAVCMANDKSLMESACIAQGMFEARNVARKFDEEKVMQRIAKNLAGKQRED